MLHTRALIVGLRTVIAVLGIFCADSRVTRAEFIEKPVFFATRGACAASKMFRTRECDNAFENAGVEMRARRLSFASKLDCMVQFELCERRSNASGRGFAPVMLGVEIIKGPSGGVAAPVIAIDTARGLF